MTDGDWALFNRQPTLHKMGMMAHEIIVNRGANTFQLPVPCTPPYNADFDGDEMNLHVFQSPVAISEAKNIMAVPQCLISPKDSKPIIAPVQDAVIGTYLLTSKDTFLKPGTFFDLTMWARHSDRAIPEPAVFYKKDGKWNKLYTGKQLVTHYTPRKIRLQRRVRDLDAAGIDDCFDLDERLVKFEDGELLCGKLCKGTIGGVSRGCIQAVCKAHGNWRAAKWISDLQRIATQFLLRHGFSIGLSDCLHGKAIQDDVDEIVQGTYRRVTDGVAKARGNGFSEAAIEGPCQDIFSSVLSSVASSVLASIPDDNNIRKCIESGAKGKKLNITQIHGCVGQQIVAGARVRDRTDPFQSRTFPCYEPGDEDPRAFGFCPSSYVDGLEPVEFFTHAQGGREGLIDTACRTAETGYIQRRLITILQSEKAGFDGTVRDANNGVVQFQYGGDRLNTERLIKVGVPCMTKLADLPPDAAARAWCGGAGEEADRLEEAIRIARSAREVFTTDPLGAVHLPFDLQDHFCVERNGHFPDPEALMGMVAHAEAKIVRLIGPPKSSNHFFLHLRSTLVSKRLEGVSIDTVSDVLDECLQQTEMALVEGGTMVGTIAAQSVGEPATQMTLNSVEYDTGLVLRWRKAPVGLRNACIGETIDTLLDVYAEKVETPEARTSYLPLEAGAAEALTVDDKGRVSWKALEAVTRHPPINKDGSPTLLKVTTKSGRTVTATKAISFLVVRAGEVVPLEGDKLCVGDKLPLVATLPETMIGHICLDAYLDPKRYIFTTVMRKALEKMEQTPKRKPWYSEFYPHLPYSRSDACREALEKRPHLAIPGFVYTKMHNRSTQPLPEVITLNRSFGFFIGAYLAEGCSTDHQIHIANNDARYRMNAATWPSSLGIRHHITNEKDRIKNNGISISIMFHSSLLAKLVKQWCDCGSWNKRVPDFAYSAPDEFVRGLLDAYISGDGSVALNGSITASSRSLALIEGISLLLRRFCISSSIGKTNVNDAPQHSLYITISDAKIFQQHISLCISEKDCRISCSNPKYRCSNGKILNDVLEDPVVSIEEVVSPHEFVYDLTVAETRNMVTLSGLGTRDTFHSAGTGNRTVMSGVPRFKEMIDCTKNPKAPSMTIFLNDDLATSKDAVQEIAHGMRKVLLAECVLGTPTVHHKTDAVPEDEGMVERYRIVRGWDPTKLFDFYARVVLDKSRLAGLNIGLRDAVRALRASLDEKAIVLASEPGEEEYAPQIHVFKTTALRKGFDRAQTEEESTRLQRDFVHNMVDILVETTRVSGLENVKNTFVVKKGKQYAIETEGTEFTEVLASGDAVAVNKTVSNNIHDVFPVLGISATATLAFCEMTMAMTSQGGYISPRHLELLAMKMTFPGQSIPVNRHGMAKTHGVLLRASFERTVDTFVNAGVHSDFDPCKGICQSIVLGQAPPCGTGYVSLIDDPTVMPEKRAAKKRSAVQEDEEEFVGRRKKKKAGEKRWKEAASSWNFTFDPRRKFRLFLMKTNAFVPMSPVAPTANMVVEEDDSPKSPSYSPDSPFANTTTPLVDDDSMECATPPEDDFDERHPCRKRRTRMRRKVVRKDTVCMSASSSKSTSSPSTRSSLNGTFFGSGGHRYRVDRYMESPVYKKNNCVNNVILCYNVYLNSSAVYLNRSTILCGSHIYLSSSSS